MIGETISHYRIVEKLGEGGNRAGEVLETVGQPQTGLLEFALSPDRRRVATTADAPPDIWIQDLDRSAVTRLTFEGLAFIPTWTPTGKDIVYVLAEEGAPNRLMRRAADGTGQPVVLMERGYNSGNSDWSREGGDSSFGTIHPFPTRADKGTGRLFRARA